MGQEYSTIDPSLLVAQTTWVRSLANHLVRDPDGAEDVAQETLLAALASPPQDAADAQRLRAWLGRVVFNLAHLARRRNSRRRAREERAARSESQRSVAESYVARTVDGLLLEAVEALEDPYRTAVQLRYFEGLSTAEVARRTGTSDSAVRKRLWRARGKLRRELDRRHNGERHAWFRALTPLAALPRSASEELGVLTGSSSAVGLTWKLAAAVPLLTAGLLAGRSLLGPESTGRPGAVLAGTLVESSAQLAGATRRPLDSSRGAGPAGPGDLDRGGEPRVELRVVGLERDAREERPAAPEVQGQVIDLWGNPLGGVELFASSAPEQVLGRSGANGAFTLRVKELPVTLDLRAPGLATLRRARVERGEQAWHQWLVAAPAVALSGRVLDPDGRPVADADLQVVCDESAFVELPVLLDFSLPEPGRITDASGAFAFDSIPTGDGLFLQVRHPGFEPWIRPVPDLSQHGFVIRLAPDTDLRNLAGIVLDEDQRPLPGVEIAAGEATTTTTAQGTFSLQVRGRSRSEVVARKDGYESVRMRAEPSTDFRQHLRMVMQTAAQFVQGEVVDDEGQPLEGWVVFARPETADTEPGGSQEEAVAVSRDRSGADGTFRLEGLARGQYSVFGVDPTTLLTTEPLTVRGGRTGVELRAEKAEIAALFPGRVVGRDRRPVADARVQAELRVATDRGTFVARSESVRTDASGRFALNRLAARLARIRIDHPSVHSVQLAGADPGAATREFVVDVMRPVRFTGQADSVVVLDAGGRCLPVRGFVQSHARAPLWRGRSAIVGVGAEACTVVWYRDGAEVGREELLLRGDELTEIER